MLHFAGSLPVTYLHYNCHVSHRDDFNIEVLHAFVELHEFTDLNLVQALR